MTTVSNKPIYVTKPYLPPLDELIPHLDKIWQQRVLTNGGEFHQALEEALCDYLGVKYVSLFANGTLALITALQALEIKQKVITTPYSFVATSNALHWNNIVPVFADINQSTFNIDPAKIEAAITPETTAIMPVHVYGYPCDVDAIQDIADKYNLSVIYDAAHAFGVKWRGESILNYGDLSILSFHATKVFNTFEGGAIVCHDKKTKQHIDRLKNFGFCDEVTVVAPGINSKMSEFNAALGMLQLKYIDQAILRRKEIDALYRKGLSDVSGIRVIDFPADTVQNYSYFPILVEDSYKLTRNELYDKLKQNNIYARRYFYPLISDFPIYQSLPSARSENVKVAKDIASQIICLPIYPELDNKSVEFIIGNIV